MLVVDHVRRSFGSVAAVRDVSFTARRGTIFGLLGPNGAGKTTTMRMILGIFEPDTGTLSWQGEPISLAVRRRFGYMPEERGLYAKMRVRDQIAYFARLHGVSDADARVRTKRWIERLELQAYADRPCGELSKGNQQKVQLAISVVHEPELIVLDEPFSGLDPLNAEIMLSNVRALADAGATLVLSSHQMFQIENACESFCIIGAGEVRAAGTLAQLRANFPTRVVRVAPGDARLGALFLSRGATPAPAADGALAFEMPAGTDFGELLRAAVATAPLEAFDPREPSLDEIYRRALGERAA